MISSMGSWEKWLPLAKFSYNNSYQESIKMAPFEALYGRKCRTPLNWIDLVKEGIMGLTLSKKLKNKFELFNNILKLLNRDRRVMQIKGEVPLHLKLGILYI